MKWYFAVNAPSLQAQRQFWESMILTAVRSALRHTDLVPHLMFDGGDDPFLRVLDQLGVTIVRHRVSFYDALERHDSSQGYLMIASGAFLRTEIPTIEDDPFVLYTDCDVMFAGAVELNDYRPDKFACAPEFQPDAFSDFNTGVMLMNVESLREDLDEFTTFIRDNLSTLQAYDQGAYRVFYEGCVDPLDPIYNWKPYWGTSSDARIVHFHGVKPQHARRAAEGETLVPVLQELYDRNPTGYRQYVEQWAARAIS
jgi:glycosyl transferase family 8